MQEGNARRAAAMQNAKRCRKFQVAFLAVISYTIKDYSGNGGNDCE